jgi:hypothetical protein
MLFLAPDALPQDREIELAVGAVEEHVCPKIVPPPIAANQESSAFM